MFVLRESSPTTLYYITQISLLAVPFIIFIFFKGFYADKPTLAIIGKTLLVLLLTILGYVLFIVIVSIVGIIIAMIMGPETLKYLKAG